MPDRVEELAQSALERLERILGAKEAKTAFQDMSEVTRTIVRMRNELIDRLRAEPSARDARERLDKINALLSVTASAEMPLQGIQWARMKKTREHLAEIVGKA